MIYEPREDSFLLQKQVKKYARGKVLDMGTGSGIQALTAKEKGADVLAVDCNPEAVNNVKKRGIKAIVSDLFEQVQGTFDVILFNPPYLPETEEEDAESKQITTGGKQGHELLERFLKEAKKHLKTRGSILIVVSSLTGDVSAIIKKYNYQYKVLDTEKIPFETLTVHVLKKTL